MKKERLELIAIKKILPHGGIKMIAERTDLSYRMVQHVLAGKYKNEKVIQAAIEIIKEDNKKKREFLNSLLQMISLE